ncbi:MAG: XamI family restriction endonuclease, partial [Coriobacteriia bacterium]|nr:XamI family restriction endonuclease [Coriobacteriia bacterium]
MINADRVQQWKTDIAKSVQMYNDWFFEAAPQAFKDSRMSAVEQVLNAFSVTDQMRSLTLSVLRRAPQIVSVLRMMAAPPLARDRLAGLSEVRTRGFIKVLEDGRLPKRMDSEALDSELQRICKVIAQLLDSQLMPWIGEMQAPDEEDRYLAAMVIADRLCSAISDPIIRNAQEARQLAAVFEYLDSLGYSRATVPKAGFKDMREGTYALRANVMAGINKPVNIPADVLIQPKMLRESGLPILIECKSAGDYANTNKRRKEEAQKVHQLRESYGNRVEFVL